MPTIAVTDLLIHPRENDLVAGTYGRGIFITDISPLQELNKDVLEEEVYFFPVEPAAQRVARPWGNYSLYGDRHHSTPNEPDVMRIYYYLKDRTSEEMTIRIKDTFGDLLCELKGSGESGINTVSWNMRAMPADEQRARLGRWARGELQPPGTYRIELEFKGRVLERKALIKERTGWKIGPYTSHIK